MENRWVLKSIFLRFLFLHSHNLSQGDAKKLNVILHMNSETSSKAYIDHQRALELSCLRQDEHALVTQISIMLSTAVKEQFPMLVAVQLPVNYTQHGGPHEAFLL